jgi:hypothetical protein
VVIFGTALLLLTGCLRNLNAPSRWPPEDFLLEVVAYEQTEEGLVEPQSMYVFADGLVLFRRASNARPLDAPAALPVFDTLSVYQLQQQSLRGLTRALDRAKLFRTEPINDVTPSANTGRSVSIRYRAFGVEGEVSNETAPAGALDRIVRLVNGYAPQRHPFTFRGLGVTTEARFVDEVPEPERSLRDALVIHDELARLHPELQSLWLDTFVLALSLDERDAASRALEGLENATAQRTETFGSSDLPGLGTPENVLATARSMYETRWPDNDPTPTDPVSTDPVSRDPVPADASNR